MATAYVEVPLSGKLGTGLSAIIDVDDYELVISYRWWRAAGRYHYAVTDICGRPA